MALTKTKKSKPHGKYSSKLHTSKLRTPVYSSPLVKKLILIVIILAIFVVIIAVFCSLFFSEQHSVESKIESLASDYYENYFYKNFTTSDEYSKIENLDSAMEKYRTHGFAPVTLRQLLLYDDQKNSAYADYLTKYCDENATSVRFYPESPYSKTSYRAEYTYSCAF